MAAFLGMRGTGDFVANQRPESWREMVLRLYPNGMAPLTAILSKMTSESVTDPVFHWWTKSLPTQGGDVTGVYTDPDLTTAYVSGGVADDLLYVKMAAATASEIRAEHTVCLMDTSDPTMRVQARVLESKQNGASSYIAVRLLEADDNSTAGNLSDCDSVLVSGNGNPEGAQMPDSIAYDPTEYYNYTQIFRTPLEITRTAKMTKLRTDDAYKEAKREALELHSIEMEKAFLLGVRASKIGSNGKPLRYTGGLIPSIETGAAANVSDFSLSTSYTGKTWLQAGEEWMDTMLELIFRYGSQERLGFAGSGALLGIQRLVKATGQFNLTPETQSYGIKVLTWVTPFGTLYLKTHPLFSFHPALRNQIVIFEPKNLKYRYITDTTFKPDKSSGWTSIDGTKEEYLTECGLEHHFPISCGILRGVGVDNSLH